MTEQSFRTCRFAYGCFDPCCDAPCPKRGLCGVEQGSDECFTIVCPTCESFEEKDDAEKYTDENIISETKTVMDQVLSEIVPENVGRPVAVIMIGDMGFHIRNSTVIDSDDDDLIYLLTNVVEFLKEQKTSNGLTIQSLQHRS